MEDKMILIAENAPDDEANREADNVTSTPAGLRGWSPEHGQRISSIAAPFNQKAVLKG
jgi:hypothetical protein